MASETQELITEYYSEIYNYLLRGCYFNKNNAEDLVQETFLNILNYIKKHKNRSGKINNKRAWIYAVARNVLRQHYRRRSIKATNISIDCIKENLINLNSQKDIRNNPDTYLSFINILDTMKILKEKERTVIDLKIMQKMKYKEIAVILGCPENSVKSIYKRSIAKIKQTLNMNKGEDGP